MSACRRRPAGTLRGARKFGLTLAAALAPGCLLLAGPGGARAATAAVHALPSACSEAQNTVTCTFLPIGAEQSLPVPAGVYRMQVTAIGAGGAGALGAGTASGGDGGEGAEVSGTVNVSGVPELYVEVGGTPTSTGCNSPAMICKGGWNGGGQGGDLGNSGSGGGGASDVRTVAKPASGLFAASLASRLLIAAGGGGGGNAGNCSSPDGGDGGNAGAPGGGAGACGSGTSSTGGQAGRPDGTSSGGVNIGGCSEEASGAGGSPGQGGGQFGAGPGSGGGGGGGLSGGGAGASSVHDAACSLHLGNSGGGGGSSLVPPGGTGPIVTASPASVTITYSVPPSRIADLSVRITGPRATGPGGRFSETITVTDTGPAGALGITTRFEIPRQLTVVRPGTAGQHAEPGSIAATAGGTTVSWADPVLAAGGTVRYHVMLRAGLQHRSALPLRAAVASAGSTDPNAANNSAAIGISVNGR